MPHQGICASRTGSHRLYKHRVNNGAESAAKHKKSLGRHRPFHEILHGICYQRSEGKNCHAWILYEWFILVFGVPAKLLSDRGTNFTSALVEELCSAFGIQKCRTTAYHAQCNGQVERFHQTLFRMIGKLAARIKRLTGNCISLSFYRPITAPDPCSDGVLTPLPHVWKMTTPPCRFFLPYY